MPEQHVIAARREVPFVAAWLGGLGLIPFVAAAAGVAASGSPWMVDVLRFYAATILAFMGGVHWGLAIGDERRDLSPLLAIRLSASVVPALIAWLALLLAPLPGLVTLAIAFVLLLSADLLAVRRGLAPRWYPRLRVPLTVIATLSLIISTLF